VEKPFATIHEQLAILNRRGVVTDADSHEILLREGYYSVVNGYKDPFLLQSASGEDRYRAGTKFSEIYRLFIFDRRLRMVLFKYLAAAEAVLKTVVSYCFAEKHQQRHYDYLDAGVYREDRGRRQHVAVLIGDFRHILAPDPASGQGRRKKYIAHYIDSGREVPIWVLVNYLTLGQAFRFYDLQKEDVRFAVARTFMELFERDRHWSQRITHKQLRIAYDHIKDVRNICAHDERLYCARVSPKNNVTFAACVNDLELALTEAQYASLLQEIANEIIECARSITTLPLKHLLSEMGYSSLNDLVYAVG
jgi:abortive infection bacteriophage resistance protein